MFKFAFVANLSFPNGRIQGVRGDFVTEVSGGMVHDALVNDLKSRHTNGDQVPQVTVFEIHQTSAE
jgi:hypothetical protein